MKTKGVSKVRKTPRPRKGAPSFQESRRRIVAAAGSLFLERGFQRTTSDDIAAELGISKATLYKAFISKEDILRAVVRSFTDEIGGQVDALMADPSLSFVERLVALFSFVGDRLSRFAPWFLRDVQRTAPGVWKDVEAFRHDKLLTNFKVILESGRRQGLFRSDVDAGLLLRMFIRLIEEFINPAEIMRSGGSPTAAFESVIKVFFQGILTDKGRRDFKSRTPYLFEPGVFRPGSPRKEGASGE